MLNDTYITASAALGRYDHMPIDVVTSRKKVVDVRKFYSGDQLRPQYTRFAGSPTFIMTSDY